MLRSGLSPLALCILCEILLIHFDDGAAKNIKQLCSDAQMSRTRVYVAIKELKESGMLRECDGRFFVESPKCSIVEPKIRRAGRKIPDSGRKIPDSGRKNPGFGTLFLIADNTQTIRQRESSDMGKIVGEIRRSSAGDMAQDQAKQSDQRKGSEKRKVQPADDVTLLEAWFEQKMLQPRRQITARVRKQWESLLEMYGSLNAVQHACERAYAMKDRLCTDDYPIFGLQTIVFFATYKDKVRTQNTEEQERRNQGVAQVVELINANQFGYARSLVAVLEVRESELSGKCNERDIAQVYAEVSD
jgi:hypothetical protein